MHFILQIRKRHQVLSNENGGHLGMHIKINLLQDKSNFSVRKTTLSRYLKMLVKMCLRMQVGKINEIRIGIKNNKDNFPVPKTLFPLSSAGFLNQFNQFLEVIQFSFNCVFTCRPDSLLVFLEIE